MSETASSQQSLQKKKREIITSDFLKTELTRIFSKVEIEKSKYYAYRMNKFLEIPLDAVYKDQSIMKLTQNKAIINESLSKVPNVTILNERKIIVLNYSFNKNELFVPQKQLVEQDKTIVSLKDHHEAFNKIIFIIKKEVKKIIQKGNTFIITLETRESVQSVKEKLLKQDIKAFDEREKFYYDLIENIEKQKSIPTISDKALRQVKTKESFIGYHKGVIQGYISQTIPPVSPSTQYLNPLQFLQIIDPNFLRRNTAMDSIQFSQQNQNNQLRKKNKPQIETPKQTCTTPQYRRKRLLSQGHNSNDDQLVFEYDNSSQSKNQQKNSGINEEVIYEKKKNTSQQSIASLKSPKQVQFKDEHLHQYQKKLKQKVQSTSQFEKTELEQSDQMSNESSDIYKRNQYKLKPSKSSELFKDTVDKNQDYQRESLFGEDSNTASTQQIEVSECNFTPKITLLQMEINQNQEDSESDQEEDKNEKEKFHPQTTDSFRPNNYQKLEQIDDLEI